MTTPFATAPFQPFFNTFGWNPGFNGGFNGSTGWNTPWNGAWGNGPSASWNNAPMNWYQRLQ